MQYFLRTGSSKTITSLKGVNTAFVIVMMTRPGLTADVYQIHHMKQLTNQIEHSPFDQKMIDSVSWVTESWPTDQSLVNW